MAIYFIGDTHFGHHNIRKYCGRPYDHENRMWLSLKACIEPHDVLVHLGDFMFREHKGLFDKLPGQRKILIRGNHDKKYTTKLPWDEVLQYDEQPVRWCLDEINVFLAHDPKKREYRSNSIFIHGHIHEKGVPYQWDKDQLIVNTSVEQWEYYPVSWSKIRHIYNKGRV